tara:strand:- start:489 stop:662 length:174 start_codon:yes stop_codon:yes gene_type:complete
VGITEVFIDIRLPVWIVSKWVLTAADNVAASSESSPSVTIPLNIDIVVLAIRAIIIL